MLLPALGLFSLGVVVGAGLGLMFAPKPGNELRGDVRRGIGTVRTRLRRRSNGVADNHDLEGDDDRDSITVVPTTQA